MRVFQCSSSALSLSPVQPPILLDHLPSRSEVVLKSPEKKEAFDVLRDQRRSIPALVVEFDCEVDRLASNADCLIEQNSDLKRDIICLEEQKRTEKLQGKIIDGQISQKEYEIL